MLVFVVSCLSCCKKTCPECVQSQAAGVPIATGAGPAVGAPVPTGIVDGLPVGMPVPHVLPGSGEPPMIVVYSFKAIGDEAVFGQVKAGLAKTDGVLSVQKAEGGVQVVFQMSKLSGDQVRGLIAGIAGDAEFARPNQCVKCVGNPACSCFDAVKDASLPAPAPACDCAGKEGCPCSPR